MVSTACSAANGSGNLATTVTMKVGAVITYTVQAAVAPTATGSIVNVATVTAPPGIVDPVPANGSSSATVPIAAVIEPPEAIPTLDTMALAMLILMLGAAAGRYAGVRRRS